MKNILLICFLLLANIQGPLFTTAQVLEIPINIIPKVETKPVFDIKIYPNPTTDQLTINYTEVAALRNVEVYNLLGRLVERFPVQSTTRTILSLENFSAGMYLVKVNGKEFSKTLRVKRI